MALNLLNSSNVEHLALNGLRGLLLREERIEGDGREGGLAPRS